jgi:hypothetical protein
MNATENDDFSISVDVSRSKRHPARCGTCMATSSDSRRTSHDRMVGLRGPHRWSGQPSHRFKGCIEKDALEEHYVDSR